MNDIQKSPLPQIEKNALLEASRLLREYYPIQKIILFGSKARGDSDQYSDIDILLLSTRPLSWREEKQAVELLFDIGLKYDVIFSPLFASSNEWEDDVFREFPIYKEIAAEGAVVT